MRGSAVSSRDNSIKLYCSKSQKDLVSTKVIYLKRLMYGRQKYNFSKEDCDSKQNTDHNQEKFDF